jgi:hypothetical protein
MRRILLATFALATVVALAFVALQNRNARKTAQESLPMLAGEIGVTFPPETRLVGVRREHGIDDFVALKLRVPAAALPSFVSDLPFGEDDFRPGDQAVFGETRGFWDPAEARFERYVEGRVASRALQIGIATAENGWVAVYIVCFGT